MDSYRTAVRLLIAAMLVASAMLASSTQSALASSAHHRHPAACVRPRGRSKHGHRSACIGRKRARTQPRSAGRARSSSGISSSCGWGSFSSPRALPSACWRPFADSSWLNTPLPASAKLLSNSATLVSDIMSSSTGNGDGTVHALHPIPTSGNDYGNPYFFGASTDPAYTIQCTRNCNNDGQAPNGQIVHIPCGAKPSSGSDHQMSIYDQSSGVEYDFWDVQTDLSSCQGGTLTIGLGGILSINGDGRGVCTDAACVGGMAGIILEQEVAAGQIDHAIKLVDHTCNGTAVYPAWGSNSCGGTNSTAPAVGQWFRLNLTSAQIQALPGIAAWQKTILTALSVYGGWVGDQGSNGAFEFQTDSPATYMGHSDPWNAWANNEQNQPSNNITYNGTTLDLNLANGLPANFWSTHLQAIDPCVIQHTC